MSGGELVESYFNMEVLKIYYEELLSAKTYGRGPEERTRVGNENVKKKPPQNK